jgi:hypothetical protein
MDQHRTCPRGRLSILLIESIHPILRHTFFKLSAKGILANAAEKGGALRGFAHPLGNADGVLRGPAGDVLDLVAVD